MSGEPPFDPGLELEDEPSDEELQAANALREALDGRRPGTHLPEPALETAALLRFSTDRGRLSPERSATVRSELLASLAPVSGRARKRRGWRYWLGISLTFAGGATAVVVIGVIGARQLSTPAAREEASFSDTRSAAASSAAAAPEAPGAPADPLAAAAPPPPAEEPAAEAERFAASEGAPAGADGARGSGALARPTRARSEALRLDRHDEQRDDEGKASLRRMASASAADKEAAAGGGLAGNVASRSSTAGGGIGRAGGTPAAGTPAASTPAASAPAAPAATARSSPRLAQPVAKADESAAEAKKSAPVPPTEQVERESRKYRAQVLAELHDPRVDGAYAELDRAQSKPELERAQARLRSLESGFGGADAPPNAHRIRPDLYCRLAEVALRLGQPKTALDWVQRGLELGVAPSPFVARLYLLQGQARSALGDRDGAAKSYMKAIEINEQLLDESLDGRQ